MYVSFEKYGIEGTFLVKEKDVDALSKAIEDLFLVARLKDYGVRYKKMLDAPFGKKREVGMFSILNGEKIFINIVLTTNIQYELKQVDIVFIKNYKTKNDENFQMFIDELDAEGLYKKYVRDMENGVLYKKTNDIVNAFKVLEKVLIKFK